MRDWFPVSAYGVFGHLCDVLHPNAKVGSLFNDIHPDHGLFSPILVNAHTREMIPVARFFDVEQFLRDLAETTDQGRRPAITKAMVSLSVLRNFDPDKSPSDFGFSQLRELLQDCFYRLRAAAWTGPSGLIRIRGRGNSL